jgi:AcrR family transcriptional regulator
MALANTHREAPSSARRDAILAAATELFAERGYHAVGMRVIAEAVGIRTSSLYHHFASKQQLLAAIAVDGNHAFIEAHAPILEGDGPPEQRLHDVLHAMILYYWEHRLEREVGLRDVRELAGSEPEIYDLLQSDLRRFQRGIENAIIEGVDSGVLESDDPKLTARAIIGMCLSVNDWFRPGRSMTIERVADHYADLVLDRLLPPTRPAAGA